MPPEINAEKCISCGECVEICTEDVFFGSTPGEVPTVTYPRECVHFSGCIYVCPEPGAITLRIPLPVMLVCKPSSQIPCPDISRPSSK